MNVLYGIIDFGPNMSIFHMKRRKTRNINRSAEPIIPFTRGGIMDLKSYFENNRGTGIISTADSEGNVDCAVYARPHVMEDGTIAMIMRDRLSHKNLQSNPKAAYMFIEKGPGYKGKRLFLTKVKEEKDSELIDSLKRRTYSDDDAPGQEGKFLVYFTVEKELPLIGSGKD
jgi:hypothetical protein